MKIVVSGSENINETSIVEKAIEESHFVIDKILSKSQNEVDVIVEEYAKKKQIPYSKMTSLWSRHGQKENEMIADEMSKFVDAIIVINDEFSLMNQAFVQTAINRNIPFFVYNCKKKEKINT
jgi:DNA-binding LacI/PurR family transcriptional regulator